MINRVVSWIGANPRMALAYFSVAIAAAVILDVVTGGEFLLWLGRMIEGVVG